MSIICADKMKITDEREMKTNTRNKKQRQKKTSGWGTRRYS